MACRAVVGGAGGGPPGFRRAHTTPLPSPAPQVRPGLAKMAVKGMWGYMQAYQAALR